MEGSPSLSGSGSSNSNSNAGNAAIESGVCKYCKGTGELRSWKKPPAGPAGAAAGGGDSTSTSPSHQPHRLPGVEEPAAAVAVAAAGRPDPVPGRLSRASSFLADDPASSYADSSSPGAAPVVSSSRERFPGEAQALSYLSLDYGSDIVRRFHWTAAGDFDAGARYTPLETPSLRYDDAQQSLASVSEDGSSQVEGSSASSSIEEHYSSASVLQGLRISYDGTALERSFGYPAHLVGTSLQWWENRIHSDDKPRVLLSLKRALESEHSRYWAESYRFRIYRPPPFSSSTRPPGARFRAPPSSSPQSGGLHQASGSRPVQPAMSRTVSTVSATSNNSSNTSGNSNTPTEVGGDYYSSGSSSGSSARRQHGVDHPEDYITVLDQLYITRAPGTRKPTHALGVMCSAEQRVKIAEALHAPRSALLRSLPKGGVSYIGSEIIGTILQNTASGLFMMDANGYPTYMNQAASDITGYLSIDEISNAPLHYAVHYKRPDGTDYPMEECPLDNANATLSRVQNQTEVFVKKDGTLFPVVWSCAPLERLGKTVGAVIEFRDVTEERKLEQDRFQATLTSKQQQIRIKEAESHRQRMSQFVDYIAHELRNPLHGISANIDFLRDSLQAVQSAVQVYNANLEGGSELPPMMSASRPSSYLASHDQILLRGNREALTGSPSLPTSPLAGGTRGPSHRASYQDLSHTPFGAHFKGSHTTQPWQAETKHSKASGQGSVPPLLSDFTTSTQSVGASATGSASMSGSGQQGPISPSLAHPAPQQLQQKTGGSGISMSESVSSSAMLSDMPSSSGRASPSLGFSTPILDIQQSLTTSQSFIASIYECVSHATHITNNVLDLSRLEAGKVELLHDLVQPNRVANLAMDMMGARAQEKDISLSLSGPTEATLIRGDGTRLAQIFLNLISNAIKFTPPGGHVSVTFRLEPAGERILLSGSVTDSGVGMSEEEMGNLFQRFGQSSRSIQAEYGGTGLGLSICQEIVTLQGGRMKVDSRKGEGSTFTFTSYYTPASEEDIREYHRQTPSQSRRNSDSRTTTLSSKKEDDVQDVTKLAMQNFMPILADASSSGTPTTPSLLSSDQRKNYFKIKERIESVQKAQEPYKFKHILVAEDNSINQNIMRTYLKKLGYAFTIVGNGQEALDMVINKNEGGTVDVILMDCEMPILDGRQATSRIRQHEAHSKLLVAPIDSPFDLHATAYNINFASQQQQGPSVLHPLGTASPGTTALNRRMPIIGLSGNARRELIEEAFVAGMDDYVVKPFKLPELEKVLKKWENIIESRMLAASSRDIVRDVLGMDLASPSSTTPTDARPSLISRPSKSRLSEGEMWHAEAEQPEPPRLVSPHSSASTVPSLSSRTSSVQPTEINTPPPGRGEGATSEDMKEQDYA